MEGPSRRAPPPSSLSGNYPQFVRVRASPGKQPSIFTLPPGEAITVPAHLPFHPAVVTGLEGSPDFEVPTQVAEDMEAMLTLFNPHCTPVSIRADQIIAKAFPFGPSSQHPCQLNWARSITLNRPTLIIHVENYPILGIIDTGADCSVINLDQWRKEWPLMVASTPVQGVGGNKRAQRSARALSWSVDDNAGRFTPLCLPELPYALWGRDVLAQMQLSLVTPDCLPGNG